MRLLGSLLALVGCGPQLACGPNTEQVGLVCEALHIDDGPDTDEPGVDDERFPWEDVYTAKPCELVEAGDRIDLVDSCLDGVCAGDAFSLAEEAWPGLTCSPSLYEGVQCTDGAGTALTVSDANRDGEADEDESILAIEVQGSGPLASADGLGLGAGIDCFFKPESLHSARLGNYRELEEVQLHGGSLTVASYRFAPGWGAGRVNRVVLREVVR